MAKYRKKPVVIEAFQFPDSGPEQSGVSAWVKRNGGELALYDGNVKGAVDTSTAAKWHWTTGFIETLEGIMRVNIGDYIIKGIKGEFYPCKPDIFEATYELVED